MGEGVCRKKKLFTAKGRVELESLKLGPWASYRRQELLRLFEELQSSVKKLDQAVELAAESNPLAARLMTHPGVGPITSLAFVLIIGPVERFDRSKQVVSYLGLNPQEHSSGGRQRLGSISKQGNPMMRSLLVEAGHSAARLDPQLQRVYQRLKFRRGRVAHLYGFVLQGEERRTHAAWLFRCMIAAGSPRFAPGFWALTAYRSARPAVSFHLTWDS